MPIITTCYRKHPPHKSYYPVVSNILAVVAGNAVTITWNTDVASTSQVAYGTNQNKDLRSLYDSSLVTSHSVVLNNLRYSTVYFFNVQSYNIDSLTISVQNSFITGTGIAAYLQMEDGSFVLLEDGSRIILEQ